MEPIPILLFAKAPVPGQVKTRLLPTLGAEGAAQLAEKLAEASIVAAGASGVGPVSLWGMPDCSHPFFARMAESHGVELCRQEGADLGERMDRALGCVLRRHPAALLAGTDLCRPTPQLFRDAAAILATGTAEATLVPSLDGGYVLIGLRRRCPELFSGLDWGTGGVCGETLGRMCRLGLSCGLMPVERDLDTPADYAEWMRHQPEPPGGVRRA
jgi:hypothetical protein